MIKAKNTIEDAKSEFNQITRHESKETNYTSKDSGALHLEDLVEENTVAEASEPTFLRDQNLQASTEAPISIGANEHFANDLRLTQKTIQNRLLIVS